ncbi:HlyD family efflux transporter periplasmic adaptor subunit [Candidatus Gracilibacteria bacterium]|nr:HlyD family efflux transporter periplasmic adaptor subunit [Candidatus Gracilibacteria bacterium]NJM87510.1 HlyD family efflux transporter periplasmic adaptor subunit [Hydrococcus sp. RU_2_2]NJP18211.1 HlyD family efflux transporter periplasmic adaptor subunit [Hydrococcus sp. CRU_1_1]
MQPPFKSPRASQSNTEGTSNRSARLPPDLPIQETHETSQEESTSIQGGIAGTLDPVAQIPRSSTSTSHTPIAIANPSTTRWSPSVDTLLNQPPASFPTRLIVGGMAFGAVFGAWAWFGTIEEVGQATGRLVPEGQTYKIQPTEVGKVNRVEVREGQAVKAGQILVELDTELAQKEVERLEQMLTAYQGEITQKQILLERIQMEAQTSAASSMAEQLAQRSAIALAREKAATTRQLLMQQRSEAVAYQARKARLAPLASTAEERLDQLQIELKAHQKRLNRLKPLLEEGAVPQDYIFQAEQALRETQQRITQTQMQDITSVNEQLFQSEQSLRDLATNITQNQGELTSAYKEAEQLQAQLSQKQADALRIQLEAQQRIEQLELDIAQTKAKIADTQTSLLAAKTRVRNNYLKAPVDGIVLSLNLQNSGEVLQAGQTVAEIAPHGVPLVLAAVLPNSEAGFVKTGMPVHVKLDAYPYQDFGTISGKVANLSADTKPDEKLGQVFRVEVQLDKDYVTDKQRKIQFRAGQTATADIIIRRRRIADLLLDPIRQIQKDGINL